MVSLNKMTKESLHYPDFNRKEDFLSAVFCTSYITLQ